MSAQRRQLHEQQVRIIVDGEVVEGVAGQSVAGVLLGAGIRAWRQTVNAGAPRGLFCGIGVCFDCLVTVDGVRDVRACQRKAVDGAVVEFQRDASPPEGMQRAQAEPSHGGQP